MFKYNKIAFVIIFLFSLTIFYCTAETGGVNTAESGTYTELLSLFNEFREFQQLNSNNDVHDYTAATMEKQYNDLKSFQSRLGAIDPGVWSVSDQIDYHLVRAEMNGLEFQHRVLRPWSRDPSFYLEQAPRIPRNLKFPLQGDELSGFQTRLLAIPEHYNQAKMNMKDLSKVAGDLALFTIHDMEESDSAFPGLVDRLTEFHPDLVADAKNSQGAIDNYLTWLKENLEKMTASAGVGIENYNWMMKNIYLLPYTWNEIRSIVELEDNRIITFQKLEENRNRNLPLLTPVASAEERRRSVLNSIERVMNFIRDDKIFTIQDYIVVDNYLQGRLRSTSRPWPEKHDYFLNFSHRESLMEETHEMVGHHFDVLRQQNDDRPIRGAREHEGPYMISLLPGWKD